MGWACRAHESRPFPSLPSLPFPPLRDALLLQALPSFPRPPPPPPPPLPRPPPCLSFYPVDLSRRLGFLIPVLVLLRLRVPANVRDMMTCYEGVTAQCALAQLVAHTDRAETDRATKTALCSPCVSISQCIIMKTQSVGDKQAVKLAGAGNVRTDAPSPEHVFIKTFE